MRENEGIRLEQPTLSPKKRSGFDDEVTVVTVPLGRTSSNACTVSIVKPYWFVSHEKPMRKDAQLQSRGDVDCDDVPPPSVNPATPTPETRPPTTMAPSCSRTP